jgi:hypothetical protein
VRVYVVLELGGEEEELALLGRSGCIFGLRGLGNAGEEGLTVV